MKEELREKNKMLKRNVNKYKQSYFRIQLAKEDTPNKKRNGNVYFPTGAWCDS